MMTATTQRADEIRTDRRRHVRVVARGVASHLQTMDASMPGLAVENLSVGGMFVRSAAALAVGTRVMVQLVRPGLKKAIPTLGCVVSVVHPGEAHRNGTVAGMGIRLDPVELDAARRLRDLVADLAAAPVHPSTPPPALLAERDAELAVAAEPAPITRPSAPPPPEAQPRAIELAPPTVIDTSSEDVETRNLLVQQLEEEVIALRRELLRRNRTIGDLATRLAAYEAVEVRRASRGPVTTRVIRLSDPRAD
jgi:hypothetical protein